MSRGALVGAIVAALVGGCAFAGFREPSREAVLQRILPSAVQIVIEQREGRRVRTASGVVLASRTTNQRPTCFVLTAGHAVSGIVGEKAVYVVFGRHRGDGTRAQATVVVYRDTANLDLALLRVESDDCMPARAAGSPMLGESVWVVGFPWGRHMTLASGIVSQINADQSSDRETASQLMVDASVSYGSSGGGVYAARGGALIGVARATARPTGPRRVRTRPGTSTFLFRPDLRHAVVRREAIPRRSGLRRSDRVPEGPVEILGSRSGRGALASHSLRRPEGVV